MVKLLFDENISYRIKKRIEKTFPETLHISDTELLFPAKDAEIWNWAKSNEYVIVTYDEDFEQFVNVKGYPPKVILLRPGNQSTAHIAGVLASSYDQIVSFLQNEEVGCLEIVSWNH
jgi:predicted nuclease of predicted toxin-antitoxin system